MFLLCFDRLTFHLDGYTYCLRRIDNVRRVQYLSSKIFNSLNLWSKAKHPNIVALRDIFVHQRALFILHDYVPGAQTLHEYISSQAGVRLSEPTLWTIALQLLNAIHLVHSENLCFFKGLTLKRVLLGGQNRVRISSVGLTHVLDNQSDSNIKTLKRDDILAFSQVMLRLTCMSHVDSCDFASLNYSSHFINTMSMGFWNTNQSVNYGDDLDVEKILSSCIPRISAELHELYSHTDALEELLSMQIENSRINRLLMKLNLVNERPEYGKHGNTSWAETGDRYILKLFRNYTFHQVKADGTPWLSMGHIITTLNKLDIQSTDNILLSSDDGKFILVVSFADIRKCLESAFQELMDGSRSKHYYQDTIDNPAKPMDSRFGNIQSGTQKFMGSLGREWQPYTQRGIADDKSHRYNLSQGYRYQ